MVVHVQNQVLALHRRRQEAGGRRRGTREYVWRKEREKRRKGGPNHDSQTDHSNITLTRRGGRRRGKGEEKGREG